MPPRRSHPKSRKGCVTCKLRRVKCDESGPPCNNCKIRQTDCAYNTSDSSIRSHDTFSTLSPPLTSHSQSTGSSPQSDHATTTKAVSADRHQSELQLLHRWSTVTYKTVAYDLAKEHDIWQKAVPEAALKYDFLLNTILALAAFEMAFSHPEDATRYLPKALEHEGLALGQFRSHLKALMERGLRDSRDLIAEESRRRQILAKSLAEYLHVDESQLHQEAFHTLGVELDDDNHDAMFYASTLFISLALASATATLPSSSPATDLRAAKHESPIQQTLAWQDLVKGTSIVMLSKPDCISTHKLLSQLPSLLDLPKEPLQADTEAILDGLEAMNEARPRTGPDKVLSSAYVSGCTSALLWLRHMFQTCSDSKLSAYSLGWFVLAGTDYVQAVKSKDYVALLALSVWGVSVNPVGRRNWWARGFGSSLVEEIAGIFHDDQDSTVRDTVEWARNQIREGNEAQALEEDDDYSVKNRHCSAR